MARPNQANREKRKRERDRVEYQQEKQSEKDRRRLEQKAERDRMIEDGIDPDLFGIRPGPQPMVE